MKKIRQRRKKRKKKQRKLIKVMRIICYFKKINFNQRKLISKNS